MSVQQVFYIHGGSSYSRYEDFLEDLRTMPVRDLPGSEPVVRWNRTLATDLGAGYEVFAPSMPNRHNAKYLEWKIWFERHFEYLRDGVILLGHSQGGYFLTKYLIEEELPFQVKALLLVAAPFEPDDFGGEDGGDFSFDVLKVGSIAEKVENIVIFHSKDDFVVPFSHGEKYHAALKGAVFMTFDDRNHFLVEQFPELLKVIEDQSRV